MSMRILGGIIPKYGNFQPKCLKLKIKAHIRIVLIPTCDTHDEDSWLSFSSWILGGPLVL